MLKKKRFFNDSQYSRRKKIKKKKMAFCFGFGENFIG